MENNAKQSLKEAVMEYANYTRRSNNKFNQKKLDNFKKYFDYLLIACEECGVNDLSKKRDRELLTDEAKYLVSLGQKECEELANVTKVERADFFNGFVDYVLDGNVYSKKKVPLKKIPPVLSDMERKLDLVKNFRTVVKEKKETLYDRYYISEKTLRNDFAEIKAGSLNAFGQVVDIDYDIEKKELFSTPVPIFLVQNITQIVAILNGLGEQAKDPRYSEYATTTALLIWQQLTPEVQQRITEDLVELLHLDEEWYENLEEKSEDFKLQYYTERMVECNRGNILMYYKSGLECDVSYSKNNEVIRLKKVKITDAREDYFTTSGSDEKLEYSNLITIEETGN